MTNEEEEKKLVSDEYQDTIVNAIVEFLKENDVTKRYKEFNGKAFIVVRKILITKQSARYVNYPGTMEPFVRFKCAIFKDYRFYNSYKGRPDGLGSIRAFEDMTESNLYHYVYWRTQFLENNYKQTKREYILVYINELVNLVGVTSEEGLALLIDLWNKCDELTDLEFYDNIKDYCILHSVGSFKDIVKSFDEKFQIASYEDRIYSGD